MTTGDVCHSAMPVTIQMIVVTTVTSVIAPSPHVTLLLSSPAATGDASVQPLSVMATTTAEITLPLTKSTAVSDDDQRVDWKDVFKSF